MKTTTTTREYDTDGHMVKETVTEYDSGPIIAPCNCNIHTGAGYCPVHGYRGYQHYYQPNIFRWWTARGQFGFQHDVIPPSGFPVRLRTPVEEQEMAKIGTAHVEIKPVLADGALDEIMKRVEDAAWLRAREDNQR